MLGPDTSSVSPARRVWQLLEAIHAPIYFADEARAALEAAGMKGFWMGYFTSRAAPMGAVPAAVVTATFFNFRPSMVERAIPDAWSYATPAAILEARYAGADAMWQRLVGDDDVSELAGLARRAAEAADHIGRPLSAATAALEWPDAPHLVLWHAATVLREHRGDGHVAALVAEGVSGCAAHVLAAAAGASTRPLLQASRGWTDEEWDAAAETVAGREAELRERVEARTDAPAAPPLAALGDDGVARLIELARPVAAKIMAAGEIPVPNPIGLTSPTG